MKTTSWKNNFNTLREREAALRMRAVDLNANQSNSLVINDLTHAWDGWLYGILAAGALLPIFRAVGWI